MKTSDFEYKLPEELVAKYAPKIRGNSRLLALNIVNGQVIDKKYADLPDYINKGDLVILNDTKVLKARLIARKPNGAKREIVILEKHGSKDDWHLHKIMYKRKLASGDVLVVGNSEIHVQSINGDGTATIKSKDNILKLIDNYGSVPLPPYMHRDSIADDVARYQTIWANKKGSVAAPTASLNMTKNILDRLKNKGVDIEYITLHVGMGTFMPIRVQNIEDHTMHNEYFEIPASTTRLINQTRNRGGKIIAVGTTVARTLEYGAKNITNNSGKISGEADIFIYPGYSFKIVDKLVTNFHAPNSTVLMLAAAFAGKNFLESAYKHAIQNKYSFLSYGDSMIIV